MTKYFAFIGIGGKSNINSVLGNKKPKPTSRPKMAPDAPTIGVLYNAFNLMLNKNKSRKVPKAFTGFKGTELIDKIMFNLLNLNNEFF